MIYLVCVITPAGVVVGEQAMISDQDAMVLKNPVILSFSAVIAPNPLGQPAMAVANFLGALPVPELRIDRRHIIAVEPVPDASGEPYSPAKGMREQYEAIFRPSRLARV